MIHTIRTIAGRDRLDTGKVIIGIAHEPKPMPMGSEAEVVQSMLLPRNVMAWGGAMDPMKWPPRHATKKPSLWHRVLARVRGWV